MEVCLARKKAEQKTGKPVLMGREIVHELKVYILYTLNMCLAEDLSVLPSTHVVELTISGNSRSRESAILFWPGWVPALMCTYPRSCHTHTHMNYV